MKNEKIIILGGGESGFGSAVLARKEGFDVFLSDAGRIAEKYKTGLEERGIPYEEGGHTEEKIFAAAQVVKSPGIPDRAPLVAELRRRNVPVISEIEFAGRYTSARTVCVTGSNGKTTTTTWIYEMFRNAGLNVGLAGNIGQSFAYQVATEHFDWYVLELSSFQLDGMWDFKADIAVLTNITPDHLDRYDYRLERYAASKFRIIRNQTPADAFIYCADDPIVARSVGAREPLARLLPFGTAPTAGEGAGLDDGRLTARCGERTFSIGRDELKVQGVHNACNAMAATLVAMDAGIPDEAIAETLRSFGGVEHRLETVAELRGVRFINDSKATNVDSVWYALESMDRPVVWIAGGTDKGNDYERLYPFAPKIRALVCMGLDNRKLVESFAGRIPIIRETDSLAEAMERAVEAARPGDAVLLSPACASFDLFRNYEDRGRQFKEAVERLREAD